MGCVRTSRRDGMNPQTNSESETARRKTPNKIRILRDMIFSVTPT